VLMVTFALFISSFAIGVGGTGWLIQGEIFPTAVRGRAAAIAAAVNWLANYLLVLLFPVLQTALGLSWVMIIFAVLCLGGALFVHRVPPGRAGSALGRRGPRRLRGDLTVDRTLEQQDRLVGRLAVRLRQEAVHEERAAQAQHGEDDHHPREPERRLQQREQQHQEVV